MKILKNCRFNNLEDIKLNENLYDLCCKYNKLKNLICNENLRFVNCRQNLMGSIVCNDKLLVLKCDNVNVINGIENENLSIKIYN